MSSTLAFERVGKIGSEQAQVRRLEQKKFVAEELAYAPLSPTVKEQAGISTIAPSTAVKPHPTLRPQLAAPAAEMNKNDFELKHTIQQTLGNIAETLDEMVMTMPSNIDECEPERQHYLRIVIDLHNSMEEIHGKHLEFISRIIREDSAELERLNIKKTAELQKYSDKVKDNDTWTFFADIAKYVGYALSLVTGAALIATGVGAVAGSFLIAAGGLGLANQIMADTGAWESIVSYFTKSRDMQQQMAQWISSSLFFISMGIGLIGGVAAIQSGGLRLIDAALGTEKAIEKIGVAAGIATAGINVGVKWTEKEMLSTMAALKIIEGNLFLLRQQLQLNSSEAKKTIEMMKTLTTQTKEAISTFG